MRFGVVTSTLIALVGVLCFSAESARHSARAASVERQSSIDASDPTNSYAVVSPIFVNPTGTNSYIRLFSGVGGAGERSTFTVSVVGIPSGATYGTNASLQIPYMASVQFSIQEILSLTQAGALRSGDTGYAVYLKNSSSEAGYQHVTYNAVTKLFENGNNCNTSINERMVPLHNTMVLTNLHPPRIADFPSTITIHNHSAVTVNYGLDVYDGGIATVSGSTATVSSTAGKYQCRVTKTVGANSSVAIPFSQISSLSDCGITSDQLYANVVIRNLSGEPPNATVAHWVRVNQYNGDSNLSSVCAINHYIPTRVTSTTTFEASVRGSATSEYGMLTVTIQPTAAAASAPEVERAKAAVERPQATATATGTYRIADGTSVSLSGTYNTATNAVRIAGGGYTFTGTVTSDGYAGSYVGPSNVTGGFSGKSPTTSSGGSRVTITKMCGRFSVSQNGSVVMFFYNDGTLSGTAVSQDGETVILNGYHGLPSFGTATGNSFHGWGHQGATFQGRFSAEGAASGNALTSDGDPLTFSITTCPASTFTTIGVRG